MRRSWQFLIGEPFIWLFYCFFQPVRFNKEFERESFLERVVAMLRLILPLFLISYPFAIVVQIGLCTSFAALSHDCYLYHGSFLLTLNAGNFLLATAWAVILGIGWGIVGGVVGSIALGIVLALALGIVGNITGDTGASITRGVAIACALGIVGGTAGGISVGKVGSIIGGIVSGIAWAITASVRPGIRGGIQTSLLGGITIGIVFILAYLIGYYRLPLYIVSGVSGLRCYLASQKDPSQVFTNLHRSSLYWDELIFLPLPRLTDTLLIAANQNETQTLREIAFIAFKRKHQIRAARAAAVEIAIRDLEGRAASMEFASQDLERHDSLRSIAKVFQRLAEILPQEIDPHWAIPFARLNDVSRDASRYYSSDDRQVRRDALANMRVNLEKAYPYTAFRSTRVNKRLSKVVNTWLKVAQREQEALEKAPLEIGQIDNPYAAGPVLKLSDSRFVGRRDLVQQLEEALSRGNSRPTFLLIGERRMGKSSTLEQLPNLLGARYIPTLYDLQQRGTSSSISTFLGVIAKEIYKMMISRNIHIKELRYKRLQEAGDKNEAAIYHIFDEWLQDVERILEREDHTLLLAFDEFEKLEEAGEAKYLDLRLLLDWFRTIIQHHPRLALLFSGVHDPGEMSSETGINWAGYLVNVQILRVSFLKPEEAYKLITQPIPNFPGTQIFGEDVVKEIMSVTGCHPFLIQAICSTLIVNLNTDKRDRAEIRDVGIAVEQVLESWRNTYFLDLWERTSPEQRICLVLLKKLGESSLATLQQNSSLDEKTARQTLEALLKRDLVLKANGNYRIAAPIFCKWVENNN